jgi:hypothetical protein
LPSQLVLVEPQLASAQLVALVVVTMASKSALVEVATLVLVPTAEVALSTRVARLRPCKGP